MISIEDLRAQIAALEAAPECPKHGRAKLEICTERGCSNVQCRGCSFGGCQCANDE